MLNLAGTLSADGELAGARKLEEQVLNTRMRLLGPEHPDTLRAMNNLAMTLSQQGEMVNARKLQEQVVEARVRLLGQEHPETLDAVNNLAQMRDRFRIISNFWRLCGSFFRGSARFRSKKTP